MSIIVFVMTFSLIINVNLLISDLPMSWKSASKMYIGYWYFPILYHYALSTICNNESDTIIACCDVL